MEKINIPEVNSLDSLEGVPEPVMGDEYYQPIEDAIESGDFPQAIELQKRLAVNEKDMAITAAISFGRCLRNRKFDIAGRILRELNPLKELVEERLVYHISRGLIQGISELIFPKYEKYFSLTVELKRKAVQEAILECKKFRKKQKAYLLESYFHNLLEEKK